MRTRRLVLAKESLTELRTEEMQEVVAAAQAITPQVTDCVEGVLSKVIKCVSVFDPCPTR